jgi:hypothetical protein
MLDYPVIKPLFLTTLSFETIEPTEFFAEKLIVAVLVNFPDTYGLEGSDSEEPLTRYEMIIIIIIGVTALWGP